MSVTPTVRIGFDKGYIIEFRNGSIDDVCFESWMLLPGEALWHDGVKAVLYILAMGYVFLGIAVSSDIFMNSIEVMTSKKRTIYTWDAEKNEKVEHHVLIWNETVANLTLMALGSSAPEILLATIETIMNLGKEMGDSLGTFTIIGSAAFNLLIISAVCIVSLPTGDVKYIKEFGVFLMTSAWSLWAYVWMLLAVSYISPGVIDPWEAWLTLAFMPIFVLLSYCQDNGWWLYKCKKDAQIDDSHSNIRIMNSLHRRGSLAGHAIPGKELHVLEAEKQQRLRLDELKPPVDNSISRDLRSPNAVSVHLDIDRGDETTLMVNGSVADHSVDSTSETSQSHLPLKISHAADANHEPTAAERYDQVEKSAKDTSAFARARFRHAVVSAMSGNKPHSAGKTKMADIVEAVQNIQNVVQKGKMPDSGDVFGRFTFSADRYAVLESGSSLKIDILFHRHIPHKGNVKVQIVTANGKDIKQILSHVDNGGTKVAPEIEKSDGEVEVEFETREGSAKAGYHFKYTSAKLTFKENEYKKSVTIPIINDHQFEKDKDFYLILKNAKGGGGLGDPSVARVIIIDDDEPGQFGFEAPHCYADKENGTVTVEIHRDRGCDGEVALEYSTIDGTAVGGKEISDSVDFVHSQGKLTFKHSETSKKLNIAINKDSKGAKNFIVTIRNPSLGAKIGQRAATVCHINKDAIGDRIADIIGDEDEEEETWGGQFMSAMSVEPEKDEDGNEIPAPCSAYVLHFLTFLWKVIGACIPPAKYLGAWPAFVLSLAYIGVLTACVEQLGHLIGCVIGLKTSVTGITIIALGTSLPDTFASRTAAKQDEHADAAIGNVTGSNSVNVFLGLGLPWVLSTMYGVAIGKPYKVPTGNLTQSVIIFSVLGALCIIILILRRKFVGGELGGKNSVVKWATSLTLLGMWVLYILLASLKAYDILHW